MRWDQQKDFKDNRSICPTLTLGDSPTLDRRGSDAHPPAGQGNREDQIVMRSLAPCAVRVIFGGGDLHLMRKVFAVPDGPPPRAGGSTCERLRGYFGPAAAIFGTGGRFGSSGGWRGRDLARLRWVRTRAPHRLRGQVREHPCPLIDLRACC